MWVRRCLRTEQLWEHTRYIYNHIHCHTYIHACMHACIQTYKTTHTKVSTLLRFLWFYIHTLVHWMIRFHSMSPTVWPSLCFGQPAYSCSRVHTGFPWVFAKYQLLKDAMTRSHHSWQGIQWMKSLSTSSTTLLANSWSKCPTNQCDVAHLLFWHVWHHAGTVSTGSLRGLHWHDFSSINSMRTTTEHVQRLIFSPTMAIWHLWIHSLQSECTHTYTSTYIHKYIHAHMHTCMGSYIDTNIHRYKHTCIHTYIHTCRQMNSQLDRRCRSQVRSCNLENYMDLISLVIMENNDRVNTQLEACLSQCVWAMCMFGIKI